MSKNIKIKNILLSVCIAFFSLGPSMVQAQEKAENMIFNDIKGHWAEQTILRHYEKEMLKGYPDGSFKPDQGMKRSELITLVNRYFGLEEESKENYLDVKGTEWYAKETAKARYYGYLNALQAEPTLNAEREDVITMISLLLDMEEQKQTTEPMHFKDLEAIEAKEKANIIKFTEMGYLQGYPDGTFKPNKVINRAEIMTIAENILGYIVTSDEDLEHIPEGTKKISIIKPGITIKDKTLQGDLYISPGVNGNITIKKSTIKGKIEISGGKTENPIKLEDVQVNKILITKTKEVPCIEVRGESKVEDIKVKTEAKIVIEAKSSIKELKACSKTEVIGKGKIEKAIIESKDVVLEKNPDTIVVDKGFEPTIKDTPTNTDKKSESKGGSSGGSSSNNGGTSSGGSSSNSGGTSSGGSSSNNGEAGSGGSVPQDVRVSEILVTGADTVMGGETLQMQATIQPQNATNKAIQWSVDSIMGSARIDQTGLLQGIGGGLVVVKATAQDGSGVIGRGIITVTAPPVKEEPVQEVVIKTPNEVLEVEKESTLQMKVDIEPANATNKNVSWLVENQTGKATVNSNGLLTGVEIGTVRVKAATQDGSNIVATKEITVIEARPQPILTLEPQIIDEGKEDGKVITLKLSNGTFAQNITPSKWALANLPYGVEKGEVKRISDTEVHITLKNNRNWDYDEDNIKLQVQCPIEDIVVGAKTTVMSNGGITFRAKDPTLEFVEPNKQSEDMAGENIKLFAFKLKQTNVSGDILLNFVCHRVGGDSVAFNNIKLYNDAEDTHTIKAAYEMVVGTKEIEGNGTDSAKILFENISVSQTNMGHDMIIAGDVTPIQIGIATHGGWASALEQEDPIEEIRVLYSFKYREVWGMLDVATSSGQTTVKKGETLEMQVLFNPSSALDKTAYWEVENVSGQATIDQATGILTGVESGVVRVKVAAEDKFWKSGVKEITILD